MGYSPFILMNEPGQTLGFEITLGGGQSLYILVIRFFAFGG